MSMASVEFVRRFRPPTQRCGGAACRRSAGSAALALLGLAWVWPVAAQTTLDVAEWERRSPEVAAALEMPRETPAAKLRTVLTLLDLGYPDAAALVFPELQQATLSDAERADLVREFGSAGLLKLMLRERPDADGVALPGAQAFGQACLDAAAAAARDPQRLQAAIDALLGADEAAALAARVDLRAVGDPALEALFAALARETDAARRGALLAALAEMRPAVDGPLLAVLAEGSGQVQRDAAELAGHLRLSTAAPYLGTLAVDAGSPAMAAAQTALTRMGLPLPSPAEATALIENRLSAVESPSRSLATELPVDEFASEALTSSWWSWDDDARQLRRDAVDDAEARFREAARLAAALGRTEIDAVARYRRWLPYGLEAAVRRGGALPDDLQQTLEGASLEQLSAALAAALPARQYRAAQRLIETLGQRRDWAALITRDGLPAPLAAAARAPHREVRFAALGAIMQIDPRQSFAGSSQVLESLWAFALGSGAPAAVAAAPQAPRASGWAGELRGLGYDGYAAVTGRETLRWAADPLVAARLAVIAVDSRLHTPGVREVCYQVRNYEATRGAPIVILADVADLPAMQELAAHDRLITAVVRPVDAAGMQAAIERAVASAGDEAVTAERRQEQARQALAWLGQIRGAGGAPYDELLRYADRLSATLSQRELTAATMETLAVLGTGGSQTLLVDFASSRLRSVEERRQAAAALAASVKSFGVQLTREQIRTQYERYNASEFADAETQEILGQILDVLEAR
jgi:hypothetical protein